MDPDSLPELKKWNAWREWKPIVARMPLEEFHGLQLELKSIASPEVAAVHQYVRCTGHQVIEFVFLANYADGAHHRAYPGGIVVVPCADTLAAAQSDQPFPVPRGEYIYDGCASLPAADPAAIASRLLEIDEVLNVIAYTHGISLRWFPKYIEAVKPTSPRREFSDSKGAHADEVQLFAELPDSVRPAVARAVHWINRASQQRDATDRFIHYWFAFEGLALTLYENASDVELPLADDARRTKSERRTAREAKIREIMLSSFEEDPQQAVQDAYFQAIGSIRTHTEAVLRAVFGPTHDFVGWVHGAKKGPAKLRNDLVHQGRSSQEIYRDYPVEDIAKKMEGVAGSLVKRTIARRWMGVAHPSEQARTYTALILPTNVVPCSPGGGWEARGNFAITHQLLAHKGLL